MMRDPLETKGHNLVALFLLFSSTNPLLNDGTDKLNFQLERPSFPGAFLFVLQIISLLYSESSKRTLCLIFKQSSLQMLQASI